MQEALHANKTISTMPLSLLLIGAPRSGKSTLLQRLIEGVHYIVKAGEEPPSTPIGTKPMSVEIRRLSPTLAIIQHSRWIKQDYTEQKRLLVSHFLKKIPVVEETTVNLKQPGSQKVEQPQLFDHTTTDDLSQSEQKALQTTAAHTTTIPSADMDITDMQSMFPHSVHPPAYDTPQDILSTGLQEPTLDEAEESLEESVILHILDTGGQPEYLNLLPSLLSGPALNVLVFRLIDDLKKRYLVRFIPSEGEPSAPYVSSYTVEEALLQAYTCVSHRIPPQLPSISELDLPKVSSCSSTLLVGTHKDSLREDKRDVRVQEIDKQLQMRFSDINHKDNQLIQSTMKQLIFAVDNTDPQDAGFIALQDALLTTLQRDFKPVQLPLPWMMFYLSLQSSRQKVLSLEQCRMIATSCGINHSDNLKLSLWYLSNQFGVIRYEK